MNIIIVGCTALGRSLALSLAAQGNDIAIIDQNSDALDLLPPDFTGLATHGMPMDVSVLEAAGIKECNAMAVVTDSDNLNIVVSQLALKKYRVENVVTLVADPQRESVFELSGLKTICPTKTSAAAISDIILKSKFSRQLTFGVNTAKFEYTSGKPFAGSRIQDVNVPGYLLFGLTDGDDVTTLATDPNRIIGASDKLIFASLID